MSNKTYAMENIKTENLTMLLSLKMMYKIPKEITVFKTNRNVVYNTSLAISRLGLSIYK